MNPMVSMGWHLTTEWRAVWIVIIAVGVAAVVWAITWPHRHK